jgi:rhodanese-related sulfurtransferase
MSLVASAAEVPRITTDDLNLRLGDADLVVLDVRSNPDWRQSATKIVGSERVNPGAANQWASHYSKEKDIVLYCA